MPFVVPQQNQGFGAQAPPVPQGVRNNLQPQRQQESEPDPRPQPQQRQSYGQQQGRGGDYRQYGQQRPRPQPQQRQPEYSAYGGYGRGQRPQYRQPQYLGAGMANHGSYGSVRTQPQQQWDVAPKPQVQQGNPWQGESAEETAQRQAGIQRRNAEMAAREAYRQNQIEQNRNQLQPQIEEQLMQPSVMPSNDDMMQVAKTPMDQYRVPQQRWGMPPIMPSTRYGNYGAEDGMVDAYNKRGY